MNRESTFRTVSPSLYRNPRWLGAILFVLLLNVWHPIGYIGGGADDDRYIAGALCWVANGPCVPVNHWEGRWPLVAFLAATIGTFGLGRLAVAIPSVVATLASLFFIKKIGDRFDRRIGLAAALVLAAVPAVLKQAFTATVEPFELAFVLAGGWALVSRKPLLAGLAFAMAFQVRETAVAALVPATLLLRKDGRGLLLLAAGFVSVLIVELLVFYAWTGDPLYRRALSIGHVALPSSEMANPPKGSPLFNTEYLRRWNYDPGVHVHWLVDGLLNLALNFKAAFLYSMTPLLYAAYRTRLSAPERRAALFLMASALFYSSVLIYVLAIDPKARVMFVPIAALSLAFAIIAVRAWNAVIMALAACIGLLISLTVITQPRQARYQHAAQQFAAHFPGQVETAQPGYFGLSPLRHLPSIGSGRPYLLVLKFARCGAPSAEDPIDLQYLEPVHEARAHPLAAALGNRWSLCLYRYRNPHPVVPQRPMMGPEVRIVNKAVINRLK